MSGKIDHNWLQSFYCVYQCNSFVGASDQLGIPSSNISRHISLLEKQLGTRLFERSTRKIFVTEAGIQLYERTRHLTTALGEAFDDIKSNNSTVSGHLKLLTPDIPVLAETLTSFAVRYPSVSISCDTSLDSRLTLQDGFDVILSFNRGQLADKNWIATKVASWKSAVVASPELIEKVGLPNSINELSKRPCITTTTALNGTPWKFHSEKNDAPITLSVNSNFKVNSGSIAKQAAIAGLGFAILAEQVCEREIRDSKLQVIHLDKKPLELDLYAYYSTRTLQPPKIAALLEHLKGINVKANVSEPQPQIS
ncbi:LysR family transcriptional regulator [Vibrio marisflavi]|uniref:HTH-type transcriptional regulator DmlR n=1 Tax=Vibrio marisflavi CECT 7928 TaxID=634439 RepID=A0ABN8E4D0_9VIBR|nr:LysR family transcriptional regulator [Vibrio marisflavi]CAH0537753.1 HTH-type transcriptional regulator DmlR [Vibrio marisflavi CECT 7928]